jgi:branched-chain amino acid transport system permease protein
MTRSARIGLLLGCAAAALLAMPMLLGTYGMYLCNLVLVNIVIATGLNLLTGNAGQISLCSSSFMAIGAYTCTLLFTQGSVPFWLALPAGGLVAATFGCLLALPAMRLSGFYFALVTLGFLEITQIAIEEFSDVTGGIRGMVAARPTVFGVPLASDRALYYAILPIAALLVLVARNLLHSPTGRAFNAIRVSTPAAQALGISPARTKLIAFAVAAFYAGIGGGLSAAVVGFIDPAEYGAGASLQHITFIVVGGMGSVAGSVIGATALTLLPEALRGVQEYADFIYATVLLAFLMLLPGGLVALLPPSWRLGPARGETPPELPRSYQGAAS